MFWENKLIIYKVIQLIQFPKSGILLEQVTSAVDES